MTLPALGLRWRLALGLLVLFFALAEVRTARAQLPDPPFIDLPVMDGFRRLVQDPLDEQGEQLERYTMYIDVPLTQLRFSDDIAEHYYEVLSTLDEIEALLEAGAALGYSSEDLLLTFENLLAAPPGFRVQTDGAAAAAALRGTFLEIARTGQTYAGDLENTAGRVAELRESIEEVGTDFLGFDVLFEAQLVSPTQGARLMVQNSLAGTQALMKRRQQAAVQLNSFLLQAASQMQQDVIARRALECALGVGPCPAPSGPAAPSP